MAIAFISNATDLGNNNSAGSSYTVSFTSSGLASILEVSVLASTALNPITYAAALPSGGAEFVPTGTRFIYKYYFNSPPAGANNFVISTVDGAAHYIAAIAVEYQGTVRVSSPDASASHDSGGANVAALTTSITTVSDNTWAVMTVVEESGTGMPSSGAGATLRVFDATFFEGSVFDSNAAITPHGSYSMTANLAGTGASSALIFSYAALVSIFSDSFANSESASIARSGNDQRVTDW